jgi:hypothetical protein
MERAAGGLKQTGPRRTRAAMSFLTTRGRAGAGQTHRVRYDRPVVRKTCVRERIWVNATLLHCDLLTGRGREGKLANTTIDGEYNLSGQELPLSIMRLYLPPHGQIRRCCSETQNRDYLL